MQTLKEYDVVIVGAGPAGLTAGIYTASLALKTLILEGTAPSRLAQVKEIRNYPGFPEGISGPQLLKRFKQQAVEAGAEIKKGDVIALELASPIKYIATKHEAYTAKAVILAVGIKRRKLKIQGEDKLLGLGVSYCAVCDGPLYKGRTVAVIGEGEETVQDALLLSTIAAKTYLIPLKPPTQQDLQKLAENNIEVLQAATIKRIEGENHVEAIVAAINQQEVKIKVDGVFIVTPEIPTAQLLAKTGLNIDERGCVKVNRRQETNLPGVYAAGDCTCGGMQVATAVGEAAQAAITAATHIKQAVRQHL